MKKSALALMMIVLCGSMALVARAASSNADVVPLGDDTFSITREAKNGFNRDVEALKEQARQDAEKYCSEHNKQIQIISLVGIKPFFGTGYVKGKITFKALNPGEAARASTGNSSVAASASASTDELYGALLKLDDLRKKGILTDEEFQEEKKKLLRRSQ